MTDTSKAERKRHKGVENFQKYFSLAIEKNKRVSWAAAS